MKKKAIITRKLEDLFANHPEGLTFKQIKDAGISEFANISDMTINRRLKENGYEAQGRAGALWNHQQGHQTKKDEEKAIISRKLEDLFANHPEGLTFKQIKDAGITEFSNISDMTIKRRLKENGYEVQGHGPWALWHQQGHQTKKDEEKTIISRKLEALFADHPEGLTFKQIKDAGITEFDNISDMTIRNRLKENGYEAQGRGSGALWKKENKHLVSLTFCLSGIWNLATRHQIPDPGIWNLATRHQIPDPGIRDPGTRHQKELFFP